MLSRLAGRQTRWSPVTEHAGALVRAALTEAGAEVVDIEPDRGAPLLDGVVLMHGPDVDAERDRAELELARGFLGDGRPILGICRGAQLLNVAAGGTLVDDIAAQLGSPLPHAGAWAAAQHTAPAGHAIRLEPGSRVSGWLDPLERVNSYHHQAIKQPGEGMRPTAWAPDGVIEAVEHERHPFAVGVQWHVELAIPSDARATRPFAALVASAGDR
jgi:putative glutamine amidotransferase